jgi:multicomponent Na+:H+ antiporter subunit D
MGNILKEAYFKEPPIVNGEVVARNEAPLMMLIPMWALALMSISIGLNSDVIVATANNAAELLYPLADALPGGLSQ